MSMINNTTILVDLPSNYDQNGAIIYTMVIILFYSLSLFCLLILNIDPDDHYLEKRWRIYQQTTSKRSQHSEQSSILNSLSDPKVRAHYWSLYFGNDRCQTQSDEFQLREMKFRSLVAKRMKELNFQERKTVDAQEDLDAWNQRTTHSVEEYIDDQSVSTLHPKSARNRSTSVPRIEYAVPLKNYRRLSSGFYPTFRRKSPVNSATISS